MGPEDWKKLITGLAGAGLGAASYNRANYGVENAPPSGYQGSIPDYSLVREQVLDTYDPKRVPGSRGQRYFSDFAFVPRTTTPTTPTTPTASSGIRGTMQPVDNPQIANIRQTLFNQANVGPDSLRAANYARMGRELPDLAGRGPTGIASVMQGTSPFTGGVATPSGEDADTATITDPNQIQFFGQGVVHVPGYGVVNYLDDASLLNYLATQRGDLTPTDTDTDTDTDTELTLQTDTIPDDEEIYRDERYGVTPTFEGPVTPEAFISGFKDTEIKQGGGGRLIIPGGISPYEQISDMLVPREGADTPRGRAYFAALEKAVQSFEDQGYHVIRNRPDGAIYIVPKGQLTNSDFGRSDIVDDNSDDPDRPSWWGNPSAPGVKDYQIVEPKMPEIVEATTGTGTGTGIAGLTKGGYLSGSTDGMGDDVPASIEGSQPAALSDGEFVVPADVVSHLGNGNSDAGARQLYAMLEKVRKARTGNPQQGKEINPRKYMPRGIA